jgi:IS5 family transposase
VRVLTRIMKKVTAVAGKAGTQMRDRSRSAKLKVLAIARASRNKTEQGRQKMKKAYLQLLQITCRVTGQAKICGGDRRPCQARQSVRPA